VVSADMGQVCHVGAVENSGEIEFLVF